IEYFKVRLYIFLLVFYTTYLSLGYINSNYKAFILVSLTILQILLFMLFIFVVYNKHRSTIINYLWYSSCVLSISTIIHYFSTYQEQRLELALPRANVFLGNANTLGITLLILSLFIFLKKRKLILDYLILLFNFLGIVLTISRSTLLILLVIIGVLFLKSSIRLYKKIMILIASFGFLYLLY